MFVTVINTSTILESPFTYVGIFLVTLIVCLIVKEITSNHPNPRLDAIHGSLRVAWIPLVITIMVVLVQQLI